MLKNSSMNRVVHEGKEIESVRFHQRRTCLVVEVFFLLKIRFVDTQQVDRGRDVILEM